VGFVKRMAAVGLTAPMATQLLAIAGVPMPAAAQSVPAYGPTRRGSGGALKILYWQAATLLNPHFGSGTTNSDASRVFYEPLAGWATDGTLHPILAAEIPSTENGGLAADGRSVTWKLKRNAKWHDGQQFSADDVVFNWEFAKNPAVAAVSSGSYRDINVVKVDDFTVRVEFSQPTPFWADAFVASIGQIIPKHLFKDYAGANARDAPTNLRPVGTSAYKFVSFAPGRQSARRAESELPHGQSPVFRHARDQGWRRCRLGRARGAADGRFRLCLEPAGRGRDPEAAGGSRAWQGQHRRERQYRIRPAQHHRPEPGGRWRAFLDQDRASRLPRPPRCAKRCRC
jgi:ABC-type transport system substrate-binding protein